MREQRGREERTVRGKGEKIALKRGIGREREREKVGEERDMADQEHSHTQSQSHTDILFIHTNTTPTNQFATIKLGQSSANH